MPAQTPEFGVEVCATCHKVHPPAIVLMIGELYIEDDEPQWPMGGQYVDDEAERASYAALADEQERGTQI